MDTALKRHGWLRDGNGLISLKAILKYRHGSEPAVSLFKIKPRISVPKIEMLKGTGGNVKCLRKGEKS